MISTNMKSAALFRADGSRHLGIGHVMRCIAFAQSLGKIGVKPVFVIRDYEEKITELVQHYGYAVETIPQDSSFAEDASLTLEFASRYSAKLILTDLSNKNILANLNEYSRYFQLLKETSKFLVAIDGLGEDCVSTKIPIPFDIVIFPYYGAENKDLKFYTTTKLLLGPAYFIFRQEFIEAAKVSREIKKAAQNILVTMGGSDPLNLTIKIAKALNLLNITPLNLRIVIGASFTASVKQELERILKGFKGNYKLIMGSDNIAELMLWSDLTITGGGLTKYETAVTGTPSIIISQFDNEAERTKEFERYGSALHIGLISEVDEEDIVKVIEKLLNDYVARTEMSKRGKNLVDGEGVERITSEIPQEVLS